MTGASQSEQLQSKPDELVTGLSNHAHTQSTHAAGGHNKSLNNGSSSVRQARISSSRNTAFSGCTNSQQYSRRNSSELFDRRSSSRNSREIRGHSSTVT